MKLFILFTLFCGIFAQETSLPEYKPTQTYIANCKTYSSLTACQTCQTGFTLNGNTCQRDTSSVKLPAYVSNNQIVHPEIGYDTKEGTCTKKIKIVNAAGAQITDDKYSGDKSCLACAKYGDALDSTYTKCVTCATGYLENKGGCTPLSINPFGLNDMATNKNCIFGKYDEHQNPVCLACQDPYYRNNSQCILQGIQDTELEGCLYKVYSKESINSVDYYKFTCEKCRDGYSLNNGKCKKSSFTSSYCRIIDEKGNCKSCIPGYYIKGSQCDKCLVKVPSENYFTGDECNALGTAACDCNPNCVRDMVSYATCISRHCDLFSKTEMSTKHIKNPKCLRCEQGYQLNADNECIPCTNDCKTNDNKCVAGYYMSNNGCRKCEGRCTECISKEICVEGKIDVSYPVAVNGLPCFDGNCKSCSAEDTSICFECQGTYELINGKCYMNATSNSLLNNAAELFTSCEQYKQPEFVTVNKEIVYTDEFQSFGEVAYERDYTKITVDGNITYYCRHFDNLPYYYRYYNKSSITCAGKNRDPKKDCECVPGYYATNVDKQTDCVKSNFANCEIPLSADICIKCKPTMVLINDGVQEDPELRCGCPKENMRINANGICVECPTNCAKCETEYNPDKTFKGVKCTKCKGEVESGDKSGLAERNFNRDLTKQCKCNSGFVSIDPEFDKELNTTIVYSCYEIPSNCKGSGNYKPGKYEVQCLTCDKIGFTLSSSCMSCEKAHYPTYKENNKDVIDTCTKCPSANGTVNSATYCTDCNNVNCTTCVDENLNVTNYCRTCNKGYALIFVETEDTNGNKPRPYCVKCPSYCNMVDGKGCFLVTNISDDNSVQKFNNKYNNDEPYTESEFTSATNVICSACYDGGSPTQSCQCGSEKYQDIGGRCHKCTDILGVDKFTTYDDSGKEYNRTYDEVCNFNKDAIPTGNDILSVCQANKITHQPECTICKNGERDPSSNCTKCKTIGKYPIFDGTNHICKDCLPKCASCQNGKECSSCKGSNVVGKDCDSCVVGYYKNGKTTEGYVKCEQCPKGCSACNSATECTVCSEDIRGLGEKKDCKGCVSGYYYDVKQNECIPVDVSKGFSESKPVCLDKDKKEVDCTNTPIDNIASIIEIPVRCDTSKGVGISPDPVNRTCVCDIGYLDTRNDTEKQLKPTPECTKVNVLTNDYFCIEGKMENGKPVCTKCNADYLELKNGKCECKKTHYTSSWGSCIPCNRHNKGCKKCTKKYSCDECDAAYKLVDQKDGNKTCVGK